jgi:hypothetical protein
MKSQFVRSVMTYLLIVLLEGYTGNGDNEEDDSLDDDRNFFTNPSEKNQPSKLSRSAIDANLLENQITNAKAAGHDVEGLSADVINEWYTRGWFELFSVRSDHCRWLVFHSVNNILRYSRGLQTAVSMATIDEFPKQKDKLEQERFAREEKRAECLSKIEVARAVLSVPSIEVDPDVKAAANRLLYRFFDT